jgi:putative transposase
MVYGVPLWFYGPDWYPVRVRMAYKCRAYPDEAQRQMLARTFGCVRLVWNRTLAERHRLYHAEGKNLSYAASDAALTVMKKDPDLAFLSEVSSVPLQQALRHQYKAFSAFFAKRARYPRFKSRSSRQSATYTRNAFRMKDGALRLAKTSTPLAFVWSWPDMDVTGLDPTTVTVSRDPCGRWYVSFAMDAPDPEQLPATGAAVGVDLGIKDFAVTSDGEKIPNPRHLERRARNLARYQRRMARCQRGSANRQKAKAKVARAHRKVCASRTDFLHHASTALVRGHDVIVVEDLAIKNMARNRKLAKAISDCGWGEFRRMIEYKAARAGRHLIMIDRWYPSSKTCSSCGHLLAELSLKTRHWTCPSCRTRHDRDINAAKNILAAGLAVAGGNPGDACGADVRHSGSSRVRSAVKQEPRPVRAGIPALQGGE